MSAGRKICRTPPSSSSASARRSAFAGGLAIRAPEGRRKVSPARAGRGPRRVRQDDIFLAQDVSPGILDRTRARFSFLSVPVIGTRTPEGTGLAGASTIR